MHLLFKSDKNSIVSLKVIVIIVIIIIFIIIINKSYWLLEISIPINHCPWDVLLTSSLLIVCKSFAIWLILVWYQRMIKQYDFANLICLLRHMNLPYKNFKTNSVLCIFRISSSSSSSSSSCCATSTDLPDPLSPPVFIVDCSQKVFKLISCISRELFLTLHK